MAEPTCPCCGLQWRVGRKVGRTIYAIVGTEPADSDPLIGVMDTPALAMEAVASHNERVSAGGLRPLSD